MIEGDTLVCKQVPGERSVSAGGRALSSLRGARAGCEARDKAVWRASITRNYSKRWSLRNRLTEIRSPVLSSISNAYLEITMKSDRYIRFSRGSVRNRDRPT